MAIVAVAARILNLMLHTLPSENTSYGFNHAPLSRVDKCGLIPIKDKLLSKVKDYYTIIFINEFHNFHFRLGISICSMFFGVFLYTLYDICIFLLVFPHTG